MTKKQEKLERLRNKLISVASRECWSDCPIEEFDLHGFCGGNYDDAYNGGNDDGRAQLAREILEEYFDEK